MQSGLWPFHMRLFLIHTYTDNSNFFLLQFLTLRNLKNNLLFSCEARFSLKYLSFAFIVNDVL